MEVNMRRVTCAVLVLLVICLSARGGDLTPNGGFEEPKVNEMGAKMDKKTTEFYAGTSDSPFEGWAFGGRYEHGDYSVQVSEEAHSGKRSCQIVCNKKGRGGIASLPFKLKAGTIIQVSFWLKAKDATGGRVFLNFEGSPGDGWASMDLKTGTYDWTRFTKRAVVAGGKKGGEQTLVVFLYSTCEGAIWVDDLSITTVDVNALAEAPDEPVTGPKMAKAIPEPDSSAGYRVNVVPPLQKVFQNDDYANATTGRCEFSSARNEYESLQVVVEAPWRPVTVKDVQISDLKGPGGAVIPAGAMKWDRVAYVETTIVPQYFTERGQGWYPDPLMPSGAFTVEKLSRVPVWITLKTPPACPAGTYTGTVTIVPEQLKPSVVPVMLTVWDFALTDETHLRTMTWLGAGNVRAWYNFDWSPEGERSTAQAIQRYEEMLLEHRLGPGGEVVTSVGKGKNGQYDFARVEATLTRLIGKGMNAFIMGTAPNLGRANQTVYSPQFIKEFTEMLKAYADFLRAKGWQDRAYVYVYDEAPKSAWPEVKKICRAIKEAAPEVRILQCLNEPEGVKELTGFADVFDVYVAQYHKAGVAPSQKKGAEVWLAVCCYPMDHPNFFIEYPLLDERVAPWICWKYKANGFEYWSTTSWGVNLRKGDKWPKVPWVANTFGRYNGDGHLIYPGPDGKALSSLRLEALRDGLEDYEYLWTLNALLKQAEEAKRTGPALDAARKLLTLDELVKETGTYDTEFTSYATYRRQVADAIVALKALLEKN
jgi:hypothetical protein